MSKPILLILPLTTKNISGFPLLHWAIIGGKKNIAKYFIKTLKDNSTSLNVQDKNGGTPLNVAVQRNIYHKDGEIIVKMLCDYKADPNISDNYGCEPMSSAVLNDCEFLVSLLAQTDIDLTIKSEQHSQYRGLTPLHLASKFLVGRKNTSYNESILEILVATATEHEINIRSDGGLTTLGYILEFLEHNKYLDEKNKNKLEILLRAGADPFVGKTLGEPKGGFRTVWVSPVERLMLSSNGIKEQEWFKKKVAEAKNKRIVAIDDAFKNMYIPAVLSELIVFFESGM